MWRVGFFGKNLTITLINEEWRVEKSKKSVNTEDGFLFCGGWNFSKSVTGLELAWVPRVPGTRRNSGHDLWHPQILSFLILTGTHRAHSM
jgi:hypothetical protein